MRLIDTHCHIYSREFNDDRAAMMARAGNEAIVQMLMPAIDSSTHADMLEAEKTFSQCRSMMGLHPCSVKENYKEELKIAQQYFDQRQFVAVGETGLDFYWDLSFKNQQDEVFQQQIEWAFQFDIPVVLYSRNSIDDCIKTI